MKNGKVYKLITQNLVVNILKYFPLYSFFREDINMFSQPLLYHFPLPWDWNTILVVTFAFVSSYLVK